MGQGHDHGLDNLRHEKPLRWALALTLFFLGVEVVGAWLSNSLALLSDAAHMGSDTLALAIALAAVRLARRPPDARRTYGYARMEALGALANGALLFLLAGWILWEAVGRFLTPHPVATGTMLLVATLGLAAACLSGYANARADANLPAARTPAIVDFKTYSKPNWPKKDLQAEHTGTVTLSFHVGESGKVIGSKVVNSSGHPGLDKAARAGIEKCNFIPAKLRGKAVASWQQMQYVWTLE